MIDPFDSHGNLLIKVCETARLARDPAYDGVFFVCVRTTKIYCRPVCRVKMPLAKNVCFVVSAAAAEARGFRPCLRCRPETLPLSPAWRGTQAVVQRALSIIEEGYLNNHSIVELAERLGVGARHLNRLFVRHAGSSIRWVAATHRLHRAKCLISDTNDCFGDIAFASGFGSVRRFNAVIRAAYGRTPSQLRSSCQE